MSRFLVLSAVLAAMCFLCSGNAWAARGNKVELSAYKFAEFDTDGDGKISITEFTAKFKGVDQASAIFRKGDKNGDKFLSKEEFEALKGAKKEAQQKKK
jgi:Ca2+-binding EF-hand superfamily protein